MERTGRKVHLTVYENDNLMFMCRTPEDAARVVKLLNRGAESSPPSRVLTAALPSCAHALGVELQSSVAFKRVNKPA